MNHLIKKVLQPLIKKIRGGGLPIEKLIERGLVLGKNVKITGDEVIIDNAHCWLIEICDDVVIAPRVIILAHDASSVHNEATKIGRVKIGKKTFIGAGSIILPNVTIGENVVIGAGSVVTRSVPDNSIVAGNPAKIVGDRRESEQRHKMKLLNHPSYKWPEWAIEGGITNEQKEKMKSDLVNSSGYLVNSTAKEYDNAQSNQNAR